MKFVRRIPGIEVIWKIAVAPSAYTYPLLIK
jgi:hypothetical protein